VIFVKFFKDAKDAHGAAGVVSNLLAVGCIVLVSVMAYLLDRHRLQCRAAVPAVQRERLRIARELHDIVGHRLLAIAMHARQLRMVATQSGHVADEIDDLVRQTQSDVRRTIGMLRCVRGGDGEPLSSSVTEFGTRLPHGELTIQFDNIDLERHVDPQLRRTALKIVQESVTNAVKHGRGPVRMQLSFGSELVISVVNGTVMDRIDILPDRLVDTSAGFGLRGLRERVAAHGGSFVCGPVAGGGFAVRACLPVHATSARGQASDARHG
jgi:signal transduction histidine kinase